jgi:hypothetical protein
MTLSEDVSDNDSTDDKMESDEDYLEPREGDSENTEYATLDDHCCNKAGTADNCFVGEDKMKWGKAKSSTYDGEGKILRQIYLGLLAKQGRPLCHLKHRTVSLQLKF